MYPFIAPVNCCAKEFVLLFELDGLRVRLANASAAAVLVLAETMLTLPPALRRATRQPIVSSPLLRSDELNRQRKNPVKRIRDDTKVNTPLRIPGVFVPALVER